MMKVAEGLEKTTKDWPRVSVIMLNWNSIEDTRECLESFKKVTYPNYDIIVVDNASQENEADQLRKEYGDQITVIANSKNLGFPEGNNTGIRRALENGSEFVNLINNDVTVDSEFLTEQIKIAKDPAIGMVGSKILNYYDRKRLDSAGGEATYWLMWIRNQWAEEDRGQFEKIVDRDFVLANSMLIRKDVFDKVGLMDPEFFFGAEEYDLCLRVKRAGFRIVYVPKSIIYHKSGRSRARIKDFPETEKIIKENMGKGYYKYTWRLSRKHYPFMFIIPFIGNYVFSSGQIILGGSPTTMIRHFIVYKNFGGAFTRFKNRWLSKIGGPGK